MKTRHVVLALGLSLSAPAWPQFVTLTSPVDAARWGAPLALTTSAANVCASPPFVWTGALSLTLPYIAPAWLVSSNGVPPPAFFCTAFSQALPIDWSRTPGGFAFFQANAPFLGFPDPMKSNLVPLRFDPEFQVPYSGNLVKATLSTDSTFGYSTCMGRSVRVFDRETVGVPMPPPYFRTPYEMFVFQSGGCGTAPSGSHRQLLNLELPARIGTVLVYDNAAGAARWRIPQDFCLAPPPACPLNQPPAATYFPNLERTTIVPLIGNGTGVFAVVAIAYDQPDLRIADLQDLWWGGPSEAGWGLTIAQDGQKLFVSTFIYDRSGKPVWVVMPNGQWDNGTHVFYGDLYIPRGAPFTSYGPNLFDMGSPVGSGSLSFLNDDEGHFDYTMGEAAGGKSIARYVFAQKGTDRPPYGGIWWGGPEQAGWGLSVVQQGESIFATWYTYGLDGNPAWFFMPAGQRTANGKYAGKLYKTHGGAWPGVHVYDGKSTQVTEVGTMELAFTDKTKGTMTSVVDGKAFVYPIVPFFF